MQCGVFLNLQIRVDTIGGNGPGVNFNPTAQELRLFAGDGFTLLDSQSWDLRPAVNGAATVDIAFNDATSELSWYINGTLINTFVDLTVPPGPGNVALLGNDPGSAQQGTISNLTATTGTHP